MGLVWYYADSNPVISRHRYGARWTVSWPTSGLLPAPGHYGARGAVAVDRWVAHQRHPAPDSFPASVTSASAKPRLAGEQPSSARVPRVRTRPVPDWDGQAWTHIVSGPERAVADRVAELLPLYSSVHRGAGYASQPSAPRLRERPRDDRGASSAPAPTTSWSSPATPPTRSTCWPRAVPAGATSCTWTSSTTPTCCRGSACRTGACSRAGRATPGATARRGARAARTARRAGRRHRRVQRHRRVLPVAELAALAHRARRADRRRRAPSSPAPPRRPRRVRRRLPRVLRAQALRPVRRGRAGRPARLAGRRPAVPGRRRRRARGARCEPDRVGRRPARHEAGTPNVLGAVALAAACEAVTAARAGCGQRARARARRPPGGRARRDRRRPDTAAVARPGPTGVAGIGVVTFTVDGCPARTVAQYLWPSTASACATAGSARTRCWPGSPADGGPPTAPACARASDSAAGPPTSTA